MAGPAAEGAGTLYRGGLRGSFHAFNPPSPAYLNYIDWRVLTLLFCLMAVVAGLQECGVFAVLAQRLLAGERRMRLVSLAPSAATFLCVHGGDQRCGRSSPLFHLRFWCWG